MQHNILWTGREYYSLENCLITITDDGAGIQSTIVGMYEGAIYQVSYNMKTDKDWHTRLLEVHARHHNHTLHYLLEGDGQGSWKMNGEDVPSLQGCMDVDIPLTPFTNTLPVLRLKLAQHSRAEIHVVYVDVLTQELKPVKQQYTKLSDSEYHYQNVPNDFEATIQVDEHGFVVDYPELFVRSAILESNYQ